MKVYKPVEDVPQEVIDKAYEDLPEEEQLLIKANMKSLTHGLERKKLEHAIELNGSQPSSTKLFFGKKSQLEFMAKLGMCFRNLERTNPGAWEQLLVWAETRK